MPRPTIVFLINSITGGGAERVMTRLIAYSADRRDRYDLHLVLLDVEDDAYPVPEWLTVHRLDSRKRLVPSVVNLVGVLRRLKPALVVSFLTRSNIANVMAAGLLGHGTVISERANTSSHHDHSVSGRVSRWLIRRTYSRAGAVIAVSGGIGTDLVENFGVDRARVEVIANPVDGAAVRAMGDRPVQAAYPAPYVVGMGRLVRTKNFALLIEAFAASSLIDHNLVIAGQGPLEQELRTLAQQKGVADRTHFAGFLENPFPVIRQADLYVLPSNGEGFPNGLVEAMVLGTPVISTDCRSGPSEILDDRPEMQTTSVHVARHGILVPVEDREAMTEALNLAAQPETRARLAGAAAAGAERYGLETAVARYWDAFERVLGSGTAGRA